MITSRGFGVDVMPQVYQAAPENLAINPNRMTQGMLEAFEVNDKLNRLRAFQLQQEELNANRAARINAERAKLGFASLSDDANASLVAPKTNLEALRLASDTAIQQKESALKSQGIDLSLLKTGGAIAQQPFLNEAGLITAKAAPQVAELDSLFGQLSGADKVTNFAADKAFDKSVKAAQVEKALADAAQSRATAADIAKRDERAKAERESKEAIARGKIEVIREKASSLEKDTVALEKLADSVNAQAARTAQLPASDPKGTKVAYKVAELFPLAYEQDDKGEWVPRKQGLFDRKDVQINPVDKANLERFKEQQNQAIKYLKKANTYREQLLLQNERLRMSMPAEDNSALDQAEATVSSGISDEDAGAIKWVSDASNKNHPRYKAILDSLMARGLIK